MRLWSVMYDLYEGEESIGFAVSVVRAETEERAVELVADRERDRMIEVWDAHELKLPGGEGWAFSTYEYTDAYRQRKMGEHEQRAAGD